MKVKVMNSVKKLAAITTGALFVGATLGIAGVFGSGLSTLPANLVHNGAVNAVVVVGANSQATDVLGSIDIASALTASAAASHVTGNGVVKLGILSLPANASSFAHTGSSSFTSWSPSTVALLKVNYQGAGKENYSAVENVTFLSSPVFDSGGPIAPSGLNVIVPARSLELVSSVVNRSDANATVVTWTPGLEYEVGTTLETLVAENSANYTAGVMTELTNAKVPSTLTVGTNTVALQGIATVGTSPSTSYYKLEYAVNGGASSYTNLTSYVTTGPVTLTFGASDLVFTNSSGTYLAHLGVSSASIVQNWSAMNKFGLGAWNATTAASPGAGRLGFKNDANETLNYSFSATSSFALPDSLKNIELRPLTHDYHDANNVTVTTGASGMDRFISVSNTTTLVAPLTNVTFNATHGLSGVAFGVNDRGTPSSSGAGAPNLLLEGNESLFNSTSGQYVNYSSEYIWPKPIVGAATDWYTPVGDANFTFLNKTSSKAMVRLVYELPNGNDFALQFAQVGLSAGGDTKGWNITKVLTYTASTTGNPTVSLVDVVPGHNTIGMGGYNLTFGIYNNKLVDFNLTGPVATATTPVDTYSLVPGYPGLYSSTGKELTKVNVSSTVAFGQLSFSGSVLTYTDPLNAAQTVTVAENKSNFATSVALPATANTTANTWGDYVTTVSAAHATFAIPAQNYTVALGGISVLTSIANYTAGAVLTASANEKLEVIGVGGSSFTAAGLFGTGVFPLAETDASFAGATNSVPVVVVGGPAVNTLAETLYDSEYNVTGYGGGPQFTNLTGVVAGEALVQWFTNVSAFGKQNALWVAGYNPDDTLNAAEVVAEALLGTPVVALNGTQMVLSTSASSYTGVKVVSEKS